MKWKEVELGTVVHKIIGGGTPSKSKPEYWNGDIYWASVKDMKEGRFQLPETKDTITELGVQNSSTNVIPTETIITSTRMGLGRAFINLNPMAINQDLKAIFPNSDIKKKFLLWALISKAKNIEAIGRGSTVKGIRVEDLKAVKIPLPPLHIQQKIASILSAYDNLIENNLRRIELLEQSARELYKEWFVRFKFPGYENIKFVDGLPEGWERKKLGEVCKKISDGTHDTPKPVDVGYYLVTGKNIVNGFIDFSNCYSISEDDHKEVMKHCKPEKGDIILSNIGTLGNMTIVSHNFEYSIKNVAVFKCNSIAESYYLFYSFNNKYIFDHLLNSSSGTSQKFLSLKILRSFITLFPRDEEINNFFHIIDPIYKQKIYLYEQNKLLKQARDLLLPRLMKGEIEI